MFDLEYGMHHYRSAERSLVKNVIDEVAADVVAVATLVVEENAKVALDTVAAVVG